jgi:DNA helicase INO80
MINNGFIRRLEGRMKQARHKAYQFHYEAAMSKVLREEARRKEEAREAKKNKKRKLLPVVEDPVVKVDRRKLKGKRKSTAMDEEGHGPFVVRLKRPDAMDVDDEHSRGHSFLAGRSAQRHLPNFPQPPSGDMTSAELRAYERMAKGAEKRFDHFISSVWKDIAKKDIPKAHRQMDVSLKVKQSNAKKTVQLAAKEARRWQARSTKASKEMQIKAKKAMREVHLCMNELTVDACVLEEEREGRKGSS